jgi:hypothetical protein
MNVRRLVSSTTIAVAVGGLVVGLSAPAVAHEAKHLISGASIKKHSIAGNRLKANTLTGAQIKESTLATVPHAKSASTIPALVWHVVSLENGWTVYSNGRAPSYAIDAQGLVHLRGELVRSDATKPEAFVLPAAARPDTSASLSLPIVIGTPAVAGQLEIGPDGTVFIDVLNAGSNASTEFASLEGVTYSP